MGRYSRALIPQEFKKLWYKDHDDLTEEQRIKMVSVYITTTQNYELGKEKDKIPIPKFMKQQNKVKAYESEKRRKGLEERRKREAEKLEQESREIAEKQSERDKAMALIHDWHKKRIIKLSREERLTLENFQLKQEIAKAKMDASAKQREILKKEEARQYERLQQRKEEQESFATTLGEKYEIDMDVYGIDLDNGICVRADNVPCPFTLPEE